jgi:Na+/phosphate symporter
MTEIILSIIAGLVLFLFAVSSLSDTLQTAIGAGMDAWYE